MLSATAAVIAASATIAVAGAAPASAATPHGPTTLARYAAGGSVREPVGGHGYAAWYSERSETDARRKGRGLMVLGPSGTVRPVPSRGRLSGELAIVKTTKGRVLIVAQCRPVHGPCPSRTIDARTLKSAPLGMFAALYRSSSGRGWVRAAADEAASVEVATAPGGGTCDVFVTGVTPAAPALGTLANCASPRTVRLRGTAATFVADIAVPGMAYDYASTLGIFAADLRYAPAGWTLIGTAKYTRDGSQGVTGTAVADNGVYTVEGSAAKGVDGRTTYGPQTLSRWDLEATPPIAAVTRAPVAEPGRITTLTSTGSRLIALEDVASRKGHGTTIVRSLPLLP